jgi:predicted dehydrogenase
MSRKLRVGIVGMGIMGSSVARVLARHPAVTLVAAADLHVDKIAPLCEELGIPNRYDHYEAMYALTPMDAVYIATPDFDHFGPVMSALRAGMHVHVEKPLTTDVHEATEIVNLVRETGRKLQVSYNHRWLAPYNATWKMIREGKIGQPLMGYARKSNPISVPTEMLPSWAASSSPAWFQSSHDIDLMSWWFDADPVEAHAYGVKRVLVARGMDTYDMIQAQVKYSNGAFATFEAGWIYPKTYPAMPDSYMEVVGENGQIVVDRKDEAIEMTTQERFQWPRTLLNFQVFDRWVGAFPSCIESFIENILHDTEPRVTAYDGWRVTAALDAIHRSILTGQIEKIGPAPLWDRKDLDS